MGSRLTRAIEAFQRGDLDQSDRLFRGLLDDNPADAEANRLGGVVAWARGDHARAEDLLRAAVRLNPRDVQSRANLASTLTSLGRHAEALAEAKSAAAADPTNASAFTAAGVALEKLARFAEAAQAYAAACRLLGSADDFANLAFALRMLKDYAGAVAAAGRAVTLAPGLARCHAELGVALALSGRPDEGLASLAHAARLDPNDHLARRNLGLELVKLGEPAKASAVLDAAAPLAPGDATAASERVFAVEHDPRRGPSDVLAAARARSALLPAADPTPAFANDPDPDRRLRVGFLSSQFVAGKAAASFTRPLFAALDRERVEVALYSNATAGDPGTSPFRALADVWRETAGTTDDALAAMVRADGIDVVVDCDAHLVVGRLGALAKGPAPVVVGWLDYPSTTGHPAVGYRVSDPYLDPPGAEDAYSETTVRVETYWCFEPRPDAPEVGPPPFAANGHVTFGGLGAFRKVNEDVLRLWARVLAAAPGTRLLLHAPEGSTRGRVLGVLAGGGVDAGRVDFVGFQPTPAYLATFARVDLALDTIPWSGGTSTFDSLYQGVPLVTLAGDRAIGRGGVSILSNLDLPELIARSEDEFVSIAVALANDPQTLAELRATLRARMESSLMTDAPRFARRFEAAVRSTWVRWCEAGAGIRGGAERGGV